VSRTINTTINSTLSLQPTDNPLTITASGGVIVTGADAIDGDSSTAWAISNAGTVSSTSGYGVSLAGAGSSVTNYAGGSISGTGPTSFNIISGVSITGSSGTVTNGGTISVSGGGYGAHLAGGGAVTNSGFITGGEDGVLIEGAPHWIRAELLHPIAKKVLVDVDVPRRQRHAHAPGGDLELSTKLAPLHRSPPAPWKHPYLGVNETSSRPLTASRCLVPAFAGAG
jgi:hypothetical protein